MKVLKNYAYNLSYQVLLIILPIITTPYVTRIFSSSELGTYNYYYSIVTYFVLLATMGVANYGTKQISSHLDSLRQTFWGVYLVQFLAGLVSISLYILVCLLVPMMGHVIAYTLAISLVSKTLDISWLFQGLEDFKRITIRNIIIKLTGVLSVLLFVKQPSDLLLYVFLLVIFEMMGQVVMWVPALNVVGKPLVDVQAMKSNLGPIVMLFLPQIAVSLYVTMDRTMLGLLTTTSEVGIYEQAYKIISILLTLVTSLGTVMLPRVSSLLSLGNTKLVNKMLEMSFLIYNLVIFPIIAGMLIINQDFVSMFLGADFQDARYAIAIMIFKMFFIGWTNIMGIQILIPHNRNKEFMLSTTLPAIFSLFLNFILIPKLGYIGASITSVCTEGLVWGIQLYFTRNDLKKLHIFDRLTKIFLATVLMYGCLYALRMVINLGAMMNVLILGILGVLTYSIGIILSRVVDFKELKAQFKH